MGDTNYQKLYTLFTQLLTLPPEKREEYIEQNADSEEIKEKLYEFLDSQDHADSFFDDLFSDTIQPAEQEQPPDKIGPYHIVAPAGRGGMSTVYKARHELHSEKNYVALKILRKGLDTEDILIRFHQERHLLSGLNHPAIAGFLDAGSTEKGRPWIAMEYIEGMPITEYCRKNRLGLSARIKLFRQVCKVVQYAHQQLVIHRDLKPANIMVTDEGNVRLLDFGIAKIFEPDNPEYTVPGFKGMTPEYASPEQKRGLSLSTSSDQYSLGVILYKLLTGVRAEEFVTNSDSYQDFSTAPPPKPPSSICTNEDYNSSFCYEELGLNPDALSKELQGDLDNIILKCLQPDPNQRYSSLDGLIKDIDNYFDGNPVSARTPSIGYQARKFIKRNKIEVSVAAGFILTICCLAGFAFYYAFERDRFAQELEAERDHAEAVSGFMTSVFQYADPIDGDEVVADAEAMIDYSQSEVLENKDSRSPRLTTTFLETLSIIRMNIGQYEEAAEIAKQNLSFINSLPDDELKDHLVYQAKLTSINALIHNNEFEATSEVLNTLESEYSHIADSNDEMRAFLYHHKSWIYFRHDYDFENAIAYQTRAIELAEQADVQEGIYRFYQNLSSILRSADREDEALEPMEKAVQLAESEYGENHPYTAVSYQNYATMLRRLENYEQAAHYSRKALEIRENQLGRYHPGVASSYYNLGRIYRSQGHYQEAKEAYETSLEIRKEVHGETNYRIAAAKNSLGILYRRLGEYDKAIEHYKKALDIKEQNYGRNHPQLAVTLNNLGILHRRLENYEEGEQYYRRALEIRREAYGEEHSQTTSVIHNLARLLYEKRDLKEAAELYRKSYYFERDVHEDHETAMIRALYLAETERLLGNPDVSVETLNDASVYFADFFEPDDLSFLSLKTGLGIYKRYIGDINGADNIFTELIEIIDEEPENPDYTHVRIFSGKGFVEFKKGNYQKAMEFQHKAHSIMVDQMNRYTNSTAGVYNLKGRINLAMTNYDQAIEDFSTAKSIKMDTLQTTDSEMFARVSSNLADTYQEIGSYSDALENYKDALSAIEADPKGITMVTKDKILQQIAIAYNQLGESDKSEFYLDQITSREPE